MRGIFGASMLLVFASACVPDSSGPNEGANEPHGDGDHASGGASASGSSTGASSTGGLSNEPTDSTHAGGSASGGASAASGGWEPGSGSAESGGAPADGSGGAPASGGSSGGGSGGSAAQVPTEESLPELPSVRQEHAVAAFQGEVYVLGGFTPENTATMDIYDPQTRAWRAGTEFPVGCHHPNLVAVDDLLYVAGFHLGGDSPLRTGDGRTFAYDPISEEWTPRTAMPEGTGRGASCVAALGRYIYVFGGSDDPSLSTASSYDTENDEWVVLSDLPRPRDHCFAAAIGSKLYILAGRNGGITDIEPESWVYDPSSDSYQELAPIPTPRGGVAGGVIDEKIYIFGGEGNAADLVGIFDDIEAYDPSTDTWEVLPPLHDPRHGFGGASLEGRIYLAGGGTIQGLGAVALHSVFSRR